MVGGTGNPGLGLWSLGLSGPWIQDWDTGWVLEWREGLDIKNSGGGRASEEPGGFSVGGPLMENGLAVEKGQPSLRSGLWQCGTSGRARGRPGGSSHCRPPQWTVPSHSPERQEEEGRPGGKGSRAPHSPPFLHEEGQMLFK